MPFVEVKCPSCASVFPVEKAKDVWICGYCGKPFIVEKALAEYKRASGTKDVTVPDTVKSIEYLDFSGCDNIQSITINVQSIGSFDFSDCKNLQSININANSIDSLDITNCQSLQIVNIPRTAKIENIDISDCKNLKSVNKK